MENRERRRCRRAAKEDIIAGRGTRSDVSWKEEEYIYTSSKRTNFDEKDRRAGGSLMREGGGRREDRGTAAEGERLREIKGAR